MKRLWVALLLLAAAGAVFGDSIWTGNAARGGLADFPSDGGSFLAASNSFPRNTRLEVTEPRSEKSVVVTVSGRLPTPGIFILLDSAASEELDLPIDQVLPVRVRVLADSAGASSLVFDEGAMTSDTDYNPAAGIGEIGETRFVEGAVADEPVSEEPEVADPEIIADAVTAPEVEVADESETILAYDLDDENPAADISGEGKVLYFLAPSDLRPPEMAEDVPVIPEYAGPVVEPETPAVEIVEVTESTELVTGSSVAGLPVLGVIEAGSRYLQAGAFRDPALLADAADPLRKTYPLVVADEVREGQVLYRLLVGPLTPAETGVTRLSLADAGYPGAFLYTVR